MIVKNRVSIQADGVEDVLKEWRTRAVTITLYILVAVALPAVILTAARELSLGSWIYSVIASGAYLLLVLVTFLSSLDYRLRAATILAAGYVLAAISLARFGLTGPGALFLVTMPVVSIVLIGSRAGWIATALSIMIYGLFCLFAYAGIMDRWLFPAPAGGDVTAWVTRGATILTLLLLVVVLLLRMYRFLFNALQAERRLSAELEQTYDKTLEGWAHALELRDIETAGHCHRVSEIAKRLAIEVGLAGGGVLDIHRGSLLHDVGKMGIPDSILLKPGKLTDDEFKQMQRHTTYAYELLANIPYLLRALDIPYCHHEKWDGTGYPRKLKGEEIPLSARIFSVVDVYDALISDRPYRKAWPEEAAIAYINERAGTEFDPAVVKVFVRLAEEEADVRNVK